jgi:cation diffusion facilitator CzcD-associated flavoprotein CzcO
MRSALAATAYERAEAYEQGWAKGGIGGVLLAFGDITVNAEANATAADFVRDKIRAIVRDPATADALCPTTTIGTKRMCVDTDYYAAYNRDDVTLVDVRREEIVRLTRSGIETTGGDYEVDVIVFATGFDAMTGALLEIDIRGREGGALREKWADGPRTQLGLMTAGFPNLFFVTGPGSPSVLSNMVVSIEQHVEWIAEALGYLRDRGLEAIEATGDAEDAWVAHVGEVAQATLFAQADSWYVGANIPGKPRVFMPYLGGVGTYRTICDEVAAGGYEGFSVTAAAVGSR